MGEAQTEGSAFIGQGGWKVYQIVVEGRLVSERQFRLGGSGRRRGRRRQFGDLFRLDLLQRGPFGIQAILLPANLHNRVLAVGQKSRLHLPLPGRDRIGGEARQEMIGPRAAEFRRYRALVLVEGGPERVARPAALGIDVAGGALVAVFRPGKNVLRKAHHELGQREGVRNAQKKDNQFNTRSHKFLLLTVLRWRRKRCCLSGRQWSAPTERRCQRAAPPAPEH